MFNPITVAGQPTAPSGAHAHPSTAALRSTAPEYEITAEPCAGYVRSVVSGHLSLDQFLSTMHILGIESEGWPDEALLVDLRGLVTVYTRLQLLHIGQDMACSFIHLRRMALLVLPERVTRISERAARKTGLNMNVFDREDEALGWLSRAPS